jgi:L-ascorbate metabolism protein UlaG (beta-lactamase superfamily)
MNFKIIESGSTHNCYILDDKIMIDLGLSYKTVKEYLTNIKYILLTHKHGDHFNETTIRKIVVNHPEIMFIVPFYLEDKMSDYTNNITILGYNEIFNSSKYGYKISLIKAYHDVDNVGYRIVKGNEKHIHITDTYTLKGIGAYKYDSASIECNYENNMIDKLIERAKKNGKYTHLVNSKNSHLSVNETVKFIKYNHITQLIPIHMNYEMKNIILNYISNKI